ncbi:pleckstrin homology domain-containing family J member 1-like [Asterias rubens]|uniref:pleckstrin homology domain-containing family J member 1-like n=1 Tax=Asterias rubens TaxID=7604 RepID=UPI001455B263|nr:pleckstrin homology domain-containing family J member 1-like [Asterias rubens]
MRYGENELARMAYNANNPVMQGKLFYKGIQQGKLRPVREQLQGQAYREREFRLQGNFLFYYKVNDDKRALEPLGALCLERYSVQREINADKGFLFSIAFQDDRDKKHYFLASSGQLCDQWVSAIRVASYEQLKATLIMLHHKIKRLKEMEKPKENTPKQQQQVKPSTAPSRAPLPRPKQPPQPRRTAPPPPAAKGAAAACSSTQETAAEGLLLDFS